MMAHFLIAAPHRSSGKTTISIGLAGAFSRRAMRVQAFKKGPDYIDPMWLARATGAALSIGWDEARKRLEETL